MSAFRGLEVFFRFYSVRVLGRVGCCNVFRSFGFEGFVGPEGFRAWGYRVRLVCRVKNGNYTDFGREIFESA